MRLQTTESGKPISVWTVKDELGHSGVQMLEKTYGHLMRHRGGQRGETVEYRALNAEAATVVNA